LEKTQLSEKQFDKLKFAGSAGETRGVPRFDFRDLVLAEETLSERCNKLLGPALDESGPADCTVTWSFTDHHFTGPDMWVFHPSPAGGWILPE
jgi:hypothetical protein